MEGTIEVIVQELTKLLQPLKDDLQPHRARFLFAELGINVPENQINSLSVPLNATANQTTDLVDETQELITAIDAEDYGVVTEKGISIVQLVKDVVESFIDIKDGINGLSLSGVTLQDVNAIPEKLFNYLLVRYLDRLQGVSPILAFFGILEQEEKNLGLADPNKPPFTESTFHFDKIVDWLSNPAEQLRQQYQWDENGFNGRDLFERLEAIFSRQGIPVIYDPAENPAKLDLIVLEAIAKTDVNPKGVLIELNHELDTTFTISGDNYDLIFDVGFAIANGTKVLIQPSGITFTPPNAETISGNALLNLIIKEKVEPHPFVVLGQTGASRFEVEEFDLKLGTELTWESDHAEGKFLLEGALKKGKILILPGNPDGFLAQILPEDGITVDFDLLIGVDSDRGVYFDGSGGLKLQLPTNLQLGPLLVESLILNIGAGPDGIPISIGANLGLELGPFAAVVEDMGIKADFTFPPDRDGNLGAVDLDIDFKPPTGVGLSLDAGVVKGGGYLKLDFEAGRYEGVLQLSIKEVVNVIAIGLITTKGPNGEEGQFSLLLLITAEFTPIQLGFGFTLNGVGGLVGVNRTMNLDALRDGVRANTLDNILFPSDPVANATQIIRDLDTVFPQAQQRYAFGIMGKLGWGTPTLITLELGLMLEVPNPIALAILGVIKMALPTEEAAVLKLQVNFVGIIDFEAKYISFDASLFDSKLLTFTLEGDMALRIKWGDQSNFLFSVGGFHPSYTPPPLSLPEMRRLSIGLLTGNPRLTVSTYFAVTSNTVQFGAAVDFYFGVSGFKVIGYLHFDALFQFDPFYFNISLAAGLGVYLGGSEILSIHLSGSLEGPTPWRITGRVKFKIFWVVNISVSIETTWGDNKDTSLPDINVLPKLKEALLNKANWLTPLEKTGDNPDQLVSLRTIENIDESIIAHPNRSLSVSQKVVPLDVTIEKFGTQNPADATFFNLEMVDEDGEALSDNDLKEEFAPDSFFNLKESERLSRPSFEDYNSGLEGTGSSKLNTDYFREREVEFEQIILDEPDPVPVLVSILQSEFNAFVKNGSAAKSELSYKRKHSILAPEKISIDRESFSIVDVDDLTVFENQQVTSMIEAEQIIRQVIDERPELEGQLEIVPTFEIA